MACVLVRLYSAVDYHAQVHRTHTLAMIINPRKVYGQTLVRRRFKLRTGSAFEQTHSHRVSAILLGPKRFALHTRVRIYAHTRTRDHHTAKRCQCEMRERSARTTDASAAVGDAGVCSGAWSNCEWASYMLAICCVSVRLCVCVCVFLLSGTRDTDTSKPQPLRAVGKGDQWGMVRGIDIQI